MFPVRMMFFPRSLRLVVLSFLAVCSAPSCSHLARRSEADKRPPMARAEEAWRLIAAGKGTPSAVMQYDNAVTEVVLDLADKQSPDHWTGSMVLADGRTLKIDHGSAARHDVWPPKLFDHLRKRLKAHPTPISTAIKPGLGAALDGVREHDSRDVNARFVYSKGQHLPVTAVIEFGKGATPAMLRLYDPREVLSIKVGGESMTLAADFVLPVQEVLDKRCFLNAMVQGLFRPERFSNQGLYLQEPYRPDKVPVVFVHGLMSDPHIWENSVLALMADPEIGRRVQCWCFMYPTGLPVANSAGRLRKGMEDARMTFNPRDTDAGFNHTVMIGHSMGGLLTRMQVQDSEEAYWRTWFRVPPSKIPLDGEVSKQLREALLFKANPHIKDVVFVATPHRGSKLADSWIGRMGARLIRAPQQIVQLATSVATLDVEMLAPERLSLSSFGINSVSSLSPRHPLFQALNSRPMTVPCHSIIIGNMGGRGLLLDSSDGIVPYSSSHLDEAVSEKIIPYRHSCVKQKECAEEVTRIVREHLHGRN
ncbi:MAG: alpha/beta hydrolase [Verrucomicrobiaceae bacterium]|nr:alpha/beta hydrolase [Verrucomicrobiaceae bacterium]